MSAWAGLAGGAQGVLNAWDDNREEIKAQAERDFKMKLEETRIKNAKTASDQQARDILDPSTAQGALAKHSSDAATSERNAEWAREDERGRLERQNKLSIAQAKSGQGAESGELKYVLGQIKRQDAILSDEFATERDKAAARKELKSLDADHRRLSGVAPRELPTPTANDLEALRRNPGAIQQFKERFGEEAGAQAAQRLKEESEASKTAKTTSRKAERAKKPVLSDKYPSKERGLLAGAVSVASGAADKYSDSQKSALKDKVEAAFGRATKAIAKGDRVRGEDLNLLEAAYSQPWVTEEQKMTIEQVYKQAKGH